MEKRRSSIYAGCYGLAYFSFVVLKLLYSTFSVTVFLQGFHLRLEWFYFGQAVLGAWNAVDDSLCAVLASYVHRGETAALRHVNAYRNAAPLVPLAFLFLFYPISTTDPTVQGWQYVIGLCIWDAVISYVAVSHSALGTDISSDLGVRTACKRCEIMGTTATSFVIGIAAARYAHGDVVAFQRFVTLVAGAASITMLSAHALLRRELLAEAAETKAAVAALVDAERAADAARGTGAESVTGKSDRAAGAKAQQGDEGTCGDEESRGDMNGGVGAGVLAKGGVEGQGGVEVRGGEEQAVCEGDLLPESATQAGGASGLRQRAAAGNGDRGGDRTIDGTIAGANGKTGAKRRLRIRDDDIWTKVKQTATNRNFIAWTLMQWFVYCNTVFQTKFFHMFSQGLLQGTISPEVGGHLMSGTHVARSLLTIFVVLPAVASHGLFTVYRVGTLVQLGVCLVGGFVAYHSQTLLPAAFLIVLVACSHKSVSSMFIADLTVEDQVKHLRPRSQAAFFFAVRSFFTVWGDSVVPVAVVFFLTRVGIDPSKSMEGMDAHSQLMLLLAWWGVPVALALLQLGISSVYQLHGARLESVRAECALLIQEDMKQKIR